MEILAADRPALWRTPANALLPAAICDEPYDPYRWVRRKLQREELQNQLAQR